MWNLLESEGYPPIRLIVPLGYPPILLIPLLPPLLQLYSRVRNDTGNRGKEDIRGRGYRISRGFDAHSVLRVQLFFFQIECFWGGQEIDKMSI